jgi:alpha,alpha-trehalase
VENSENHDGPTPPSALTSTEEIKSRIHGRKLVLFLDYDGTLTPIVEDPQKALLSDAMTEVLKKVADCFPLAIISGRDLTDIRKLVGMEGIYYAGSHGFDIAGPGGMRTHHQKGTEYLPSLDRAEKELKEKVNRISGAWIERKRFSIAIHYRKVKDTDAASVKEMVTEVAGRHSDLRQSGGKKIFELQPKIEWHKGKALLWLLDQLELDNADVVPFYLGDDVTDEDAFKALKHKGIGVVVMDEPRPTDAQYRLNNPDEVEQFLTRLVLIKEEEE